MVRDDPGVRDDPDGLRTRLTAALDGDQPVETGDGLRFRLPDRTLVVERHGDRSQFALAVAPGRAGRLHRLLRRLTARRTPQAY